MILAACFTVRDHNTHIDFFEAWSFLLRLNKFYSQPRSSVPPKIPLMNLLFESWICWFFWFQIHLCILACVISCKFACEAVTKFLPAQFSWIDVNVLWKFYPMKDFQSAQTQRTSRNIFTAHYACRMPNWIWHRLREQLTHSCLK